MAALSLDTLNRMSSDELTARLSASPEERMAIVRSAAEAGVVEAQAVRGQMLLDGADVPKDARAALRWFESAAKQRHAMAINMVGRCNEFGGGTPIDKVRAAGFYKAAADHGLDWGMYNYATLLTLGEGVAEDKPAALQWLRKAAALGNAKAINFIGSFCEDGWVVERDIVEAAACYARAAEGGDFRGQFNHARMLIVAGDIDRALLWLRKIRDNATQIFLEKTESWLRAHDNAEVRERGVAALRGEAA